MKNKTENFAKSIESYKYEAQTHKINGRKYTVGESLVIPASYSVGNSSILSIIHSSMS